MEFISSDIRFSPLTKVYDYKIYVLLNYRCFLENVFSMRMELADIRS